MTKRLTALGIAIVAVVWGPYVYAELARKPLPPATVESPTAIIEPTPVAYQAPAPNRAQLLAALEANQQPAAESASQANAAEPIAPEPSLAEPAAHEPSVAEPAAAAPPTAANVETTIAPATDPALATAAAAHPAPGQPAPGSPGAPGQPTGDPAANGVAAQPAAAADSDAPSAARAEAEDSAHAAAAKQLAEPENAEAKHADDKRADDAKHVEKKEGDEATNPESLAPAFRSAFDRESRDAAWASGEEPRLAQLLAGAGVPASAIGEVRCQSTVCRVALNSADMKAVQQSPLYQLLYQRVRDEFGTLGLDPAGGDGEQHAAFYVLRKGYELERARDTN